MNDSLHWLVFSSGLLSSTLLPGNSEIIFSGVLHNNPQLWISLLLAVTLGNTLGGMVSWLMGRGIAIKYSAEDLAKPQNSKAIQTMQHWGSPALLLSWIPVIGDPLCVAAGWLKIAVIPSLIFIAAGKCLRYGLLVWLIL